MRQSLHVYRLLLALCTLSAPASALPGPDSPPAAVVGGKILSQADLGPAMAEAAGALVLEERVLDVELERRMAAGGLKLPPDAQEQELRRLTDTLGEQSGVSADRVGLVLERLRRERGLGPVRFQALLLRNARLRALAGADAVPNEALAAAAAMELGERTEARLITVSTARDAGEILATVRDSSDPSAVFGRLAREKSEDSQAAQGGTLPPLSQADTSLPPALRQALGTTVTGLYPEILSVGDKFVLLFVDAKRPAVENPTPDQQAQAEAKARARLERLAMDRLAREILEQAKVSVMDESLRWSWDRRPR